MQISLSRSLLKEHRRDIGLYDGGGGGIGILFGFSIGIMRVYFQIAGMLLCSQEWFKTWVIANIGLLPRRFRCILDILSGPVTLEFFRCMMAVGVSWFVKRDMKNI